MEKAFNYWIVSLCIGLILFGACWSPIAKEARQDFMNRVGRDSVTVLPVNIIQGNSVIADPNLGQAIGAFLQKEQLAEVVSEGSPLNFPVQWSHNQAKMARLRAKTFAIKVAEANIATDYALLIEVLSNPSGTQVIGDHFYLADKTGRIADAHLTNSHWDEFRKINPRTPADGNVVAQKMLLKAWK